MNNTAHQHYPIHSSLKNVFRNSAQKHLSHTLDLCVSLIRILPTLCLSAVLSRSPCAVVFAAVNAKP